MSCGLTTKITVSASAAASVFSSICDAVLRAELDLPLGPAVGGHDLVGIPAGAQQAGQHRLAHHPGAEDRQQRPPADDVTSST